MVEGDKAVRDRPPLILRRPDPGESTRIACRLVGALLWFLFMLVVLIALGWVMSRFVAIYHCAGSARWDQAACDKVMPSR
jgi:hypothetical protein